MMNRAGGVMLLFLVVGLAACSGSDKLPEASVDLKAQQFAELMKRPDVDQAVSRYEEMYGQIRDAITATVPALKWQVANPASEAACGSDFGAVDAGLRTNDSEIRGLPNWVAEGNIPDARWEGAVSAVRGVARGYGFTEEEVTVDRPGDHEVVFHDQYRAELNFGTAVNTTLLLRTGCHLTAEARKRGVPAPEPSY